MNRNCGGIFATAAMLALPVLASADCFSNFMELQTGPSDSLNGGLDNYGRPVNIRNATAMTYALCLKTCGSGMWDLWGWYNLQKFSESLSQWLFPFLTLISQFPLGGDNPLENLMSILLTIGSPTLAAYSVTLTVFNSRWVYQSFSDIPYPNAQAAGRILNNFQQSPLRVIENDYLLGSLIVLPENDQWWSELTTFLNPKHHYSWSFPNIISIVWVVFSFLLSVMDSFTYIPAEASLAPFSGLAIAFCWIWLLAILICSLNNAPRCAKDALHEALRRANQRVYVASYSGNPVLGHFTVNRPPLSLDNCLGPHRMDHHRGAPIYNYARLMSWSLAVEKIHAAFQVASSRAKDQLPVNSSVEWSKNNRDDLAPFNRRGSPAQVAEYIQGRDHNLRHPDLGWRSFNSSILALSLTWGTIGPAILLDVALPTKGLGCRSGNRLVYGLLSTVVWAMLVISNRLSYNSIISTSQHGAATRSLSDKCATILTRTAKILACINAIWIVLGCALEFASVYDSCWCNSTVLSLGYRAYSVMLLTQNDILKYWIPLVTSTVLATFVFVHPTE
ncbi:hypothetical protein B0H19DRAFT_1010213 [Mycena capillaripes]|nr:hypothetical protein B0H19DRAFT_1010213 [Mycena capillaripes]